MTNEELKAVVAKRARGVSLICVYNKEDLLADLKRSLESQTVPYELVALDGLNGAYTNAAAALKVGFARASYDWVVFLHQDIEFLDKNVLADLLAIMEKEPRALYGVAGMSSEKENGYIVSTIREGYGDFRYETLKTNKQEVTCLDECCFACHKNLFKEIAFDEETCFKWHFYAVDLSLQARLKGIPCYAVKSNVWHKSSGNRDATYWATEKRVEKKYRGEYKTIRTSCSYFPVGAVRYKVFRVSRRMKSKIRGIKGYFKRLLRV